MWNARKLCGLWYEREKKAGFSVQIWISNKWKRKTEQKPIHMNKQTAIGYRQSTFDQRIGRCVVALIV